MVVLVSLEINYNIGIFLVDLKRDNFIFCFDLIRVDRLYSKKFI